MSYLIPLLLIVVVARLGRFFAARGNDHFWKCYNIGWISSSCGVLCSRLKGHWGPHKTSPMGALQWYHEWKGDGKTEVRWE